MFLKTASSLVAGGIALAALSNAPASAQTFSAVTYVPISAPNNQFLSVSGADGTAAQTGSLGAGVTPDGLASYNGGLYTFDTSTSSLLELNALTGATLASYSVGIPGAVAPGGLAISSSGLVFLADPLSSSTQAAPTSTLYAFGVTGGSAFQVGTTNDLLSALAFNSSDTLYGLGKGDGSLYTINTANGSGSLIGNLDPAANTPGVFNTIGQSDIAALTFSGSTLYAAADDSLYTVSTTNGAATAVAPSLAGTGFGGSFYNVSGLAPAAVPEASTTVSFGLLLVLLTAGVVAARRKRIAL